uniref:hypothetical protein n=1 Tax=Marinobacterium profundum TaxID=1714300 RepID=UPI0013156C13|nr:hypothetical protein [Marinobacterium profundum]
MLPTVAVLTVLLCLFFGPPIVGLFVFAMVLMTLTPHITVLWAILVVALLAAGFLINRK